MIKKTALILVIVLVCAGIAGAAYYLYQANQLAAPGTVSVQPVTGTLVGISTAAITVAFPDHTQKMFTVTPATQVISTVASGALGLSIAQLSVGVAVTVTPKNNDASTAFQIELAAPNMGSTTSASITGTVVKAGSSSFSLQTSGSAAMPTSDTNVLITKNTALLVRVMGGQTKLVSFADLAGSKVIVVGVEGKNGITAQSVVDLTPPTLPAGVNTAKPLSIVGTVASTSASSIVLLQAGIPGKVPRLNITVLVTKSTDLPTNYLPLTTLPLGTKVRVVGTLVDAGVITAQSVRVVPAK